MVAASSPGERVLGDEELMRRARAGDRDAFGDLVRRNQIAALRVAAVIGGSTVDAGDIVQDAMIKAYGALGTFRGRGSVRSWMLRIVANEAKNHVRGRARRRLRDDRHAALELRSSPEVDGEVVSGIERAKLAAALGRLSARDREVLGCRFVADLSEAATAEVLAVPVGTVKSRTSRALERLRRELELA